MMKTPTQLPDHWKVEFPKGIVALKRYREAHIERGIPVGLHDPVFRNNRGVLSAAALYRTRQREIARLGLPDISFDA